jgi:transcriptional regulator with XRE-family HTH domain
MKTAERHEARRLRREQGLSVKEIARRIGVSQSSVSVWVRDIDLSDDQHAVLRLHNKIYDGQRKGRAIAAANRRAERRAAQERGRLFARRDDRLFTAGCMLYWAEGGKDRNQVRFSNSDPEMVSFFVSFLRLCFGLSDAEIKVTCHLYADHAEHQHEIERFWLTTLDLPETSLCKSIVNVYSKYTKRKRVGMLPYGTCRVVVSRTHVVQAIFGAIQEIAGFDREQWLDLPC